MVLNVPEVQSPVVGCEVKSLPLANPQTPLVLLVVGVVSEPVLLVESLASHAKHSSVPHFQLQ